MARRDLLEAAAERATVLGEAVELLLHREAAVALGEAEELAEVAVPPWPVHLLRASP
jgi:hypothetical protein